MNPNQFTTITTRGFGSRLMGAIIGVPLGLLLIFGSCVMLYWNEGRTDYSKIAQKSTPVQASQVDKSQNGKFVSVTGSVTGQNIGDGAYLQPGSYVAVQRTVEEYAWVEQTQNQTHDNTGGSQTDTTTYTYQQKWVDQPDDSSSFHYPQGHQNPPKPLDDTTVRAKAGHIGAYAFNPQTIKLPGLQNVSLSSSNTTLKPALAPAPSVTAATPATATTPASSTTAAPGTAAVSPLSDLQLASSQYIYGGAGNLSSPQIGDIRISYQALPSGTTATVFGQLNGGSLTAYTDPNNHTLYDLLNGDRQTAIATLHSQYEKITWILRGVGIALIWFGLMMLLAPLDTLLDFIPFVGEIGGILSGVITFPIALILGGTVIVIGYTMHHLIALLIGVPVIFIFWVSVFKLIKKIRNIPKRGGNNESPATPQLPVATPSPAASSSMGSGSLFPGSGASTGQAQVFTPGINPSPQPAPVASENMQHAQSPGVTVSPQMPTSSASPQTTMISQAPIITVSSQVPVAPPQAPIAPISPQPPVVSSTPAPPVSGNNPPAPPQPL